MQGIAGYSDDDHSDDDLKRPSLLAPKTLPKSKSKDTISSTPAITPASTNAPTGPVLNETRTRESANSSSEPKSATRSGKLKSGINASIVRRTANPSKPIEKPDTSTGEQENSTPDTPVEPNMQDLSLGPSVGAASDGAELGQIRALLHPPPIPGTEDYGIPPPSGDAIDPELSAKVAKFLALKKQGTHFNDILMRNKSFNNPHIYAKLVDFVDVDETGTNFPKNVWDPHDIQPEWYADELATTQKKRSAEAAAAQAPGKRSRIAFNSGSNVASTSGKHPSLIAEKSRQADKDRKARIEGGREANWSGSSGSNRHHPYPRKQAGDTNMGWVPKNHGDRSERW